MGKLLSFAIPCYNSAEYMEHCINTVLAGGDEVEVIIVDDGSTKDNTYEIAKRYEKEYPDIVKVFLFVVTAALQGFAPPCFVCFICWWSVRCRM